MDVTSTHLQSGKAHTDCCRVAAGARTGSTTRPSRHNPTLLHSFLLVGHDVLRVFRSGTKVGAIKEAPAAVGLRGLTEYILFEMRDVSECYSMAGLGVRARGGGAEGEDDPAGADNMLVVAAGKLMGAAVTGRDEG